MTLAVPFTAAQLNEMFAQQTAQQMMLVAIAVQMAKAAADPQAEIEALRAMCDTNASQALGPAYTHHVEAMLAVIEAKVNWRPPTQA